MGSGTLLKALIEVYTEENFKKEILEFCEDYETLKVREKEIVNPEFLKLPKVLNCKQGGNGGWDHINNNPEKKKETQIKRSSLGGKKGAITLNEKVLTPEKRSAAAKKGAKTKLEKGSKMGFEHKNHSQKTKEQMSNTHKQRGNHIGEKNSQYGSIWFNVDLLFRDFDFKKDFKQ